MGSWTRYDGELRMPHAYNRNLAAEHGAAGRLMKKQG